MNHKTASLRLWLVIWLTRSNSAVSVAASPENKSDPIIEVMKSFVTVEKEGQVEHNALFAQYSMQ